MGVDQVVILAGGFGSRLGDLTKTTPKPLLLFNRKPFLNYLLDELRLWGDFEYVILISHLATEFESFASDLLDQGYCIRWVKQPKLGTGGALLDGSSLFRDEIILMNADTLLSKGFVPAIFEHETEDEELFGIFSTKGKSDFTAIEADKVQILNDGSQTGACFSTGIWRFRTSLLERFVDVPHPFGFDEVILKTMMDNHCVSGVLTDSAIMDMGTPDEFCNMTRFLKDRP